MPFTHRFRMAVIKMKVSGWRNASVELALIVFVSQGLWQRCSSSKVEIWEAAKIHEKPWNIVHVNI